MVSGGLLAFVAGCNDPVGDPDEVEPSAARRPNVVVYLVDTLRADRLGCYGAERDTSPGLDRVAGESAVFERAYSQAPWTLPSTTSLFTSTYPLSHRVVSGEHVVTEDATTMVEFMQSLGYYTAGFISNHLGGSGAGLDQGYDHLVEKPLKRDLTEEQRAAGLHTMRPLFDWVDEWDGRQPFFLYVHTVEPHWPYEGNPKDGEPFTDASQEVRDEINELVEKHRHLSQRDNRGGLEPDEEEALARIDRQLRERVQTVWDLYDGDIRRADSVFKRLVGALRYRGFWDDTVVVFLSDHGEEMLEHGYWFHDQSLFDELTHVPLVVRVPGMTDEGLRIAAPVQVVDVLPTLADLLGADPLDDWQGRSLLPLLSSPGPTDGASALSMRINVDRPLNDPRGERETSLVEGRWKAIVHHDPDRVSLYDLAADPGETTDLADSEPERAADMRRRILDRIRSLPSLPLRRVEEIDDEKLGHLIELGYVER